MRNALKVMLLTLGVGLLGGGCASLGQPSLDLTEARESIEDAKDKIKQITVEDLQAAQQLAKTAGDLAGANCYAELEKKVSQEKRAGGVPVKGVFSAYELLRLGLRKGSGDSNMNDPVHVACAPLVIDAERTLIRLGIIAGSGGAGAPALGGVKSAIPFLQQLRQLRQ